ncbi:hypothetical protein K461DRAFT_274123 [Myriangium duriaei CBS 260.36]|uniref:DUF676 domain-containing protein n=1 Tax=Myriangium duriaei CBS 260.36 TaxID=1168546 RepID=A0A9P4MSV0_9PEZI|nr:hypothetical protein K461DRAFT_274123 [Myriangium duriaei CBS 260.36]
MLWRPVNYDPTHTKTFRYHFGSPAIEVPRGPSKLFWDDIRTIGQKLYLLPDVVSPFFTNNKDDELYFGFPDGPATSWLTIWSLVQAPVMLFLIIATIVLIAILQLLSHIYTFFFWRMIQGPSLQVYPEIPPPRYNSRYRWIFVNGIAVGKTTLRQELKVISETFNAPVLGVNNRTYGFLGDLVECIFQRDIHWQTSETRIAEPIITKYLEDTTNVDKVILVAHSQGGIIASDILNVLFSQVSWASIHDRLEVYTFGSAALQFQNPWLDAEHEQRVIRHMEHYCHEKDLVTQFGALASVDRKDEKYLGKVFVAKGWKGHLFNQHYLKHMFPGPDSAFLNQRAVRDRDPSKSNKYWVYGNDDGEGGQAVKDMSNFWKYMYYQ